MEVCLIEVPYMVGDDRHGASKGPQCFAQARAGLLAARGVAVTRERVERGRPFGDSASASLVVCKKLASIVRKAITAGQLPLVLAGSCDPSKGHPVWLRPFALWCGLDRRAWRLQHTRNDNQRLLSWHVPGRDHGTLLPELLGANR